MTLLLVLLTVVLAAAVAGVVVAVLVPRKLHAADAALAEAVTRVQHEAATARDAAVRAALDHADRLASQREQAHLAAGSRELAHQQQLIGQHLGQVHQTMQSELERLRRQVDQLQVRHSASIAEVVQRLNDHKEITEQLATSTRGLREALANPKARGQWGERMAEDVLRLAGLQENVNYRTQTAIEGGRIPDVTFLLPRDQVLHMDVKFPLSAYVQYLEATAELERDRHLRQFLADTRARVRELAGRGYATSRGSIGYVLLFIPNESINAFIHEHDPGLLDEALGLQVVLCSPFTLFALVAVIRQAVDSFRVEQDADRMLETIGAFRVQWGKFGDAIDRVGKRLGDAQKAFDDLNGPRRRQLERPLEKLDRLRQERGLEVDASALPDADIVSLDGARAELGA